MNEPLAYRVRVYDSADYDPAALVLHEARFEVLETDPIGRRFQLALKRAEGYRVLMESCFPGSITVIDPTWAPVELPVESLPRSIHA